MGAERDEAVAETMEWRKVANTATIASQKSELALREKTKDAEELAKRADAAELQVEILERKVDTLTMNAKFDAAAREGQVKRSRIVATELEEVRAENSKLEDDNRLLEKTNGNRKHRGAAVRCKLRDMRQ